MNQKKALGILEYALSKETEGMQFYESKAKTVKIQQVKETFEDLSKMEKGHVDYISNLIKDVKSHDYVHFSQPTDVGQSFSKRAAQEIVYGGDFTALKSDIPVLRMAYLIEEDFMNFYNKAAESVEDDELKKILNHLAEWEKDHRDRIYTLYQKISKDYWEHMDVEPLY
ncbi:MULTISPECIES: ferritin family protein [Petrotoga]|uniref:Rubrerythrin n=1 Tax=Petrotoga sibirica TaxID=156202 RepID=A0A4R8EUI5_9BACT|nr:MULTISPECIES: ferritin family protein [Petrotoga]KUK83194.1 MAG: Rubrerythrin [Petrotoga mobilis]TDX16242.1 rubrerythrin [Petrotoga sibirica]